GRPFVVPTVERVAELGDLLGVCVMVEPLDGCHLLGMIGSVRQSFVNGAERQRVVAGDLVRCRTLTLNVEDVEGAHPMAGDPSHAVLLFEMSELDSHSLLLPFDSREV